jgi:NADH-quinone oxidoreductase subunit D
MAQIEEVNIEQFKHLVSARALTGETMLLNMGPQHPSTHGVLRVLLELDGETVINCIPDIGYLHTGIEKNMEAKTYQKAEVMTDRLDYMNTMGNNLAYVMAVEKLVDVDVPVRAQALRVILVELQRIASHLVWLGAFGLDLAAMSVFLYCFREREELLALAPILFVALTCWRQGFQFAADTAAAAEDVSADSRNGHASGVCSPDKIQVTLRNN